MCIMLITCIQFAPIRDGMFSAVFCCCCFCCCQHQLKWCIYTYMCVYMNWVTANIKLNGNVSHPSLEYAYAVHAHCYYYIFCGCSYCQMVLLLPLLFNYTPHSIAYMCVSVYEMKKFPSCVSVCVRPLTTDLSSKECFYLSTRNPSTKFSWFLYFFGHSICWKDGVCDQRL